MSAKAARVQDSATSLTRIVHSASRLLLSMHTHGKAIDLEEELDHMEANMKRVRALVEEQKAEGR